MNVIRPLIAIELLLVAGTAGAQSGRTFESLEAMIGQSSTVAVGRIVGLTASPWNSGQKGLELTVRVDELIKGEPAKVLHLRHQQAFREELFKQWQTDETKLLFFVQRAASSIVPEFQVHSLAERLPEGKLNDPYISAMFSMDYRLLDTPELILKAARIFVKTHPGEVKVWEIHSYPPFNSSKFPSRADANVTHLPALPEVKRMASEMVDRPERWVKRFFGPGGYPYDPVYGAELTNDRMKAEAVRNLGRSILAATDEAGRQSAPRPYLVELLLRLGGHSPPLPPVELRVCVAVGLSRGDVGPLGCGRVVG